MLGSWSELQIVESCKSRSSCLITTKMVIQRIQTLAQMFLFSMSCLQTGTYYDLRLDNALVSASAKNLDWVLQMLKHRQSKSD